MNFTLISHNTCSPIKSEHEKIELSVSGVEIMNDDPSCVRVLYGIVQSDVLQQIADAILKKFIKSGLISLILLWQHWISANILANLFCWFMYSRFGKSWIWPGPCQNAPDIDNSKMRRRWWWQNNNNKRKTFDARSILEKYAKYDFGCQTVNEIHLAVLKSKENYGFYKCTTSIKF